MPKFNFYQDIKCVVWERQHFEIEAETEDEAKRLAMAFKDVDVSSESVFDFSETLFDTEEWLKPEQNGGRSTIELYFANEKVPFATNGYADNKQANLSFDQYKDALQVAFSETAGCNIECSYNGSAGLFQAFHKAGRLVVVHFKSSNEVYRYTFNENWDSLVNHNEIFRMKMVNFLTQEGGNYPPSKEEIHDWLVGHLTTMGGNDAVDDAVPFTLEDVIDVYGSHAEKYEYKPAKLVGYQVFGDNNELPEGLFSFQIIKGKQDALDILSQVMENEPEKTGMVIHPIYEGDIEGPTFI